MTEEERREMTRSNYAAQMEMLGYDASGNPLDKVHVVRCRDCMYFTPWRHDRGDDSRCEFWNTEMGAEDYCSQAIYLNNKMDSERRDSDA